MDAIHSCLIQSCPCPYCSKNRVKLILPKGVKAPLFPFPPPPAGEDPDETLDPPLGEGFWYF